MNIKNFLRKPLQVAGLVSLLAGCGEEMPGYNGLYFKTESSTSDPGFTGEMDWPSNLEIVHRMKYKGAGFKHYLGLRFMSIFPNEVYSEMQFTLSRITNEDEGVWPNDHPGGDQFYSEEKIYGGAWCTSQVQYWLYAVMPEHKLLDEIYPAHIEDGPDIDTATGKVKPSPSPQKLEEQYNEDKADEWFEIMEDGIGVKLILIRHLDSTTSGCYRFGGYLPPDKWGHQWSKVNYFSSEPDYSVNMIKADLSDLKTFDDMPMSFFKQIIPDVDSANRD